MTKKQPTGEPPMIAKTPQRIKAESQNSDTLQAAREAQDELTPKAEAACQHILSAAQDLLDAIKEYQAVESESLRLACTVINSRLARSRLPYSQSERLQHTVQRAAEQITLGEGLHLPIVIYREGDLR